MLETRFDCNLRDKRQQLLSDRGILLKSTLVSTPHHPNFGVYFVLFKILSRFSYRMKLLLVGSSPFWLDLEMLSV